MSAPPGAARPRNIEATASTVPVSFLTSRAPAVVAPLPVVVLTAVASVLVAVAVFGSERTDDPWLFTVLVLFEGWSWVIAGLVARRRRPDTPAGLWMVAAGLCWMWGALEFANTDVLETLGAAFAGMLFPLILHVLVGFPTGPRPSGAAWLLLVVAWSTWAVTALSFAVWPPGAAGCETCSREVFPIAPGAPAAETLSIAGNALGAAYVLAAVAIVWGRRRAQAPDRVEPGDPAVAVAVGGLTLVAVFVVDVIGRAAVPALEQATVPALFALSIIVPVALVSALVREQLSLSGRVGRFLRLLQAAPDAAGLEHALADALGDATVRVGFRLPEHGTYVDAAGRPLEPSTAERLTPVAREGEPLAVIVHAASSPADPELVGTLAAAAGLELERLHLEAELRAKLAELRASRARVVEAADEARRRLERDLHDGAQQRFVAAAIGLRIVRTQVERKAPEVAPMVDEVLGELQQALLELRELARGLHPSVLTDLGLGEALRAAAGRSPIPAEVVEAPEERLPARLEATAWFVVCEALANAAKHSGASAITVRAECVDGALVLEVRDDGVGGAALGAGSGLGGLADRVGALDGRLEVDSPPGGGTLLRAVLPLDEDGGNPQGRAGA